MLLIISNSYTEPLRFQKFKGRKYNLGRKKEAIIKMQVCLFNMSYIKESP